MKFGPVVSEVISCQGFGILPIYGLCVHLNGTVLALVKEGHPSEVLAIWASGFKGHVVEKSP